MQKDTLPKELQDYINGEMEIRSCLKAEATDFTLKASQVIPLKNAFMALGFGIFLVGITSFFVFIFFGLIASGIHFTFNEVTIGVEPGNIALMIIPSIIIGIFGLASILLTAFGIKSILGEGGWFIGTSKKLIIYNNKNIRSIDWNEFSKKVKISGTKEKGNIRLQLNPGKKIWKELSIPFFKPKGRIYIAGIENNSEISELIKKRIDESNNVLLDNSSEIYPEITIEQILTR